MREKSEMSLKKPIFKIWVNTNIVVLEFYGYIENIEEIYQNLD